MAVVEAKMFHTAELKPFVLEDVQRTGRHLGVGSYGNVEELRVSGALCAGKKLHETLLDPQDEGVDCMLERFASECRLMAELRHPHVVQFLGLCFLPGVNPPLLVMERMDTSLDQVICQQYYKQKFLPEKLMTCHTPTLKEKKQGICHCPCLVLVWTPDSSAGWLK